MNERPLRTTVIGSYPFPGWLEHASGSLDAFGAADIEEMQADAVTAALHDQFAAGLDVVTDGEQTRFDFNLSFYGYIEGIDLESEPPRRFGPPAHDQRGKHAIHGTLHAPDGLGAVEEFKRLQQIAASLLRHTPAEDRPVLKASVPGPFTLAGRLIPNDEYPDRYAVTEALVPIVRDELAALVEAGCGEITVDEPSMSCYAYKSDTKRFVDIFNRTVEPIVGQTRLSTHLCFGNFKGRSVGHRKIAPMLPDFLDMKVDEIHTEMATINFVEIDRIAEMAQRVDVAVGIVDVKSYYIETPDDIADRVRLCLEHAPPGRLAFAPDCGLSQTARWAAKQKLINMVEGVKQVRAELGIE